MATRSAITATPIRTWRKKRRPPGEHKIQEAKGTGVEQEKAPAFQFYVKQWLGDDKVLQMDWDARAMHMHLMCIAWQQDDPCSIPNDEKKLRKWLGNPDDETWARVWPEIQQAWTPVGDRLVQKGLLRQLKKQKKYSARGKENVQKRYKENNSSNPFVEQTDLLNPYQNQEEEEEEEKKLGSLSNSKESPPTRTREADPLEAELDAAVEVWNQLAARPELPIPRTRFEGKTAAAIRKKYAEMREELVGDILQRALAQVPHADKALGEGWFDFHFLFQRSDGVRWNAEKLSNGFYSKRKQPVSTSGVDPQFEKYRKKSDE